MSVASHSDMPRALITGLGGFTGRYLAQELEAAGYQVFGTVHGSEPVSSGAFPLDLLDRAELGRVVAEVRPQVVAHLAGIAFVAHDDVEAIYRTNVVGARNLLDALVRLPELPRSVLLASSANVYGNSASEVVDELVLPSPINDYAVSKLAMEYMARLWTDRLPIVITRPFNYTGVGQPSQFLLPKIVGHFQRGERVIELGNIDIERDFSDVRTVAKIYRSLLEKAPVGETFNVCSGSAVSLKQVLEIMGEIAGYDIEVKVNPAFVRTNELRRMRGSAVKLKNFIDSWPQIPLNETLSWMYRTVLT